MTRQTVQIKNLVPGVPVAVQIRGVGQDGVKGQWSTAFKFTPSGNDPKPGPVKNLELTFVDHEFFLTWEHDKVTTSGAVLKNFQDYVIAVTDGTIVKEYTTTSRSFSFWANRNTSVFGSAKATLSFTVYVRTTQATRSVGVTAGGSIPPPGPFTLASQSLVNAIDLTWDMPTGAIKYFLIFRNGTQVGQVSADTLNYTDSRPGPGLHKYFVRAVDWFGQSSDSNEVSDSAIGIDFSDDFIGPQAPINLNGSSTEATTSGFANALLRWTSPVLNTDGSVYNDHEGYEIRWRTNLASAYSYVRVPDEREDGSVSQLFETEIRNLVAGLTIYWGVRAFDRSSNYSLWANHSFLLASDTTPPAAPTGLVAQGGIRTLTATWNQNTEIDFSHYKLYASESTGFTPSPATLVYTGPGNMASIIVPEGATRFFKVTAVDFAGNESVPSVQASATAVIVSGGGDTIPPTTVTGLSLTSTTYYHGSVEAARITATWTAATDNVGIDGYIVAWRRSTDAWTEELVSEGTSFVLTGIQLPGVQYSFRIMAVDRAGNRSSTWSNIATITPTSNGGAIQQPVSITTSGAIQSSDFLAPLRGYRLSNSSLEIYGSADHPVSLVLGGGGSGLNLSTTNNQLWFGASTFTNASWRVDGSGNMRVGGDGKFYISSVGDLWSGNAVKSSAPWEINANGSARFTNVRITGAGLASNEVLLSAGSDFLLRKVGSVFEARLAGNMYIDAGGNMQLAGGNITLTSGNINMNGGTFTMAGGSLNLTGTPVNLQGSNFTVTSGNIIINGGIAATTTPTGVIRSSNYNYTNKTGWALDNGSLYLFDGEIKASLITVADQSPNLIDHGYSQMGYPLDWYQSNVSQTGVTYTITSLWSRYGPNSMRMQGGTGATLFFAAGSTSYNISMQENTSHTFSAYVKNYSTATKSMAIAVNLNIGGQVVGPDVSFAPGEVKRLTLSFPSGTATSALVLFILRSETSDFMVDGVQVEPSGSATTYKVGGVTTISGAMIKTGSIVANSGMWSLNMNGNLFAQNAQISGDITANSLATNSFITSPIITGGTITGTTITGGTLQTASGSTSTRVVISSGDVGAVYFYNAGNSTATKDSTIRQGLGDGIWVSGSLAVGGGAADRKVYAGDVRAQDKSAFEVAFGFQNSGSTGMYRSGSNLALSSGGNTGFILSSSTGRPWFPNGITMTSGTLLNFTNSAGTVLLGLDSANTQIRSIPIYNSFSSGRTVVVSSAGVMGNSVSSIRYKRDVNALDISIARNLLNNLRPVRYRTNDKTLDRSTWSYYGLIAEEVALVDPRLVHWEHKDGPTDSDISPEHDESVPESDLVPSGVAYDRIAVLLLPIIQEHERTIAALEARLAALETE
jgi:hypothetical protein